jgi:hypothetical protein
MTTPFRITKEQALNSHYYLVQAADHALIAHWMSEERSIYHCLDVHTNVIKACRELGLEVSPMQPARLEEAPSSDDYLANIEAAEIAMEQNEAVQL